MQSWASRSGQVEARQSSWRLRPMSSRQPRRAAKRAASNRARQCPAVESCARVPVPSSGGSQSVEVGGFLPHTPLQRQVLVAAPAWLLPYAVVVTPPSFQSRARTVREQDASRPLEWHLSVAHVLVNRHVTANGQVSKNAVSTSHRSIQLCALCARGLGVRSWPTGNCRAAPARLESAVASALSLSSVACW